MEIAVSRNEKLLIIRLTGSLDIFTAHDLKRELESNVGGKKSEVLLDMTGVIYIDSSGMGLLIKALQYVTGLGGTLQLVNLPPVLQRTFDEKGLTRFFFEPEPVAH